MLKLKTKERKATLETIDSVMDEGSELFGCEPIGFVLLYPGTAFLKLTWKNVVGSRENTAKALMDAALDELSKVAA